MNAVRAATFAASRSGVTTPPLNPLARVRCMRCLHSGHRRGMASAAVPIRASGPGALRAVLRAVQLAAGVVLGASAATSLASVFDPVPLLTAEDLMHLQLRSHPGHDVGSGEDGNDADGVADKARRETSKIGVARFRFRLFPVVVEDALGAMVFRLALWQFRSQGLSVLAPEDARMRAASAVLERLVRHSDVPALQSRRWEIVVVDQPDMVQASCAPGGKVIIFSGMFKFCKNEHELAAVLSHEMAHVLARHGAEQLSSLGIYLASVVFPPLFALFFLLRRARSAERNQLQELEADLVGVHLMTRACYDPRKAPKVQWRFKQFEDFAEAYVFESSDEERLAKAATATHPPSEERVQFIERAAARDAVGFRQRCPARQDELSWLSQRGLFGWSAPALADSGLVGMFVKVKRVTKGVKS